jgi:hypothetical protein
MMARGKAVFAGSVRGETDPAEPWSGRPRETNAAGALMNKIAVQELLEVLGEFDGLGGASPGLVAWELFVDQTAVTAAWEHALSEGWLTEAGHDVADDEQLWKLTLTGWVAVRERSPGLRSGPGASGESV